MSKSTAKASEEVKASETAERKKGGQETQTVKEKSAENPGGKAVYSVEELIASSETALGVPRECAAAAFKHQKENGLSLVEARDIVEKFMKREVK